MKLRSSGILRSAFAAVALAGGAACTETPPPDDLAPLAWPCGSYDGDTARTITWDAQHRITYERVAFAGALQREMWTDYQGDIAVREETIAYDADEDGTSYLTEREVSGGRIVRARNLEDGALVNAEEYLYVDGALDRIVGTIPNDRGYEYLVYSPSNGVETRAFKWEGSSTITYRRNRHGGEKWTLETVDIGSPRTHHERRFDAGGWLVWEEKRDITDGDVVLFQREITRRDDGAPLWEYHSSAAGLATTRYIFECSALP